MAVLHSQLSAGERYDEWYKIRQGRPHCDWGPVRRLCPGGSARAHHWTRSTSIPTKPEETPRYHARDVAVVRGNGRRCGGPGSATPSMERATTTRSGEILAGLRNWSRTPDFPWCASWTCVRSVARSGRGHRSSQNRCGRAIQQRLSAAKDHSVPEPPWVLCRPAMRAVRVCGRLPELQRF